MSYVLHFAASMVLLRHGAGFAIRIRSRVFLSAVGRGFHVPDFHPLLAPK